jgi:hypothetical protein
MKTKNDVNDVNDVQPVVNDANVENKPIFNVAELSKDPELQAEIDKANAILERAIKRQKEKADKAARAKNPTGPHGLTVRTLTTNPNTTYDELVKVLTENGIDCEKHKSTIKTSFYDVTRIITLLKTNGHLK